MPASKYYLDKPSVYLSILVTYDMQGPLQWPMQKRTEMIRSVTPAIYSYMLVDRYIEYSTWLSIDVAQALAAGQDWLPMEAEPVVPIMTLPPFLASLSSLIAPI